MLKILCNELIKTFFLDLIFGLKKLSHNLKVIIWYQVAYKIKINFCPFFYKVNCQLPFLIVI